MDLENVFEICTGNNSEQYVCVGSFIDCIELLDFGTLWCQIHLSSIYPCVSKTFVAVSFDICRRFFNKSHCILVYSSECHGIRKPCSGTLPRCATVSSLPSTISFATVYFYWHSLDCVYIIKLFIESLSTHFVKQKAKIIARMMHDFYDILFAFISQLRSRHSKFHTFGVFGPQMNCNEIKQFLIDLNQLYFLPLISWFLETSEVYSLIVLVQLICNMLVLTSSVFQFDLVSCKKHSFVLQISFLQWKLKRFFFSNFELDLEWSRVYFCWEFPMAFWISFCIAISEKSPRKVIRK